MSTAAMDDNPVASTRSDIERVSIVLLGLGENLAPQVLKQMSAKTVGQLSQVLPKVSGVVESELEAIMNGLIQECDDAPLFADKSGINHALRKALGEKRAADLLQSEEGARYSEVLEKLHMLDPALIARLIVHEHPQLQTITLACIDPAKSAAVLSHLDEETQVELAVRLANLDSVPTLSLQAVSGLLDSLTESEVSTYNIHGVGQLAEVLNHMDAESGDALLETVRKNDSELADRVASLRFTFEHVLELEMSALRTLIENVDNDVLALALRGVPQPRQEYIYSCLGKRSAAMLREEIESGVSVRATRVNEARSQITALARRLGRNGEIELVSSREEMVS